MEKPDQCLNRRKPISLQYYYIFCRGKVTGAQKYDQLLNKTLSIKFCLRLFKNSKNSKEFNV